MAPSQTSCTTEKGRFLATARTTALTEVAALQEALDIVVDIEMQDDAEHEKCSLTSEVATPSTTEDRETSGLRPTTKETKQPKDIRRAVNKIETKVV